MNLRYYIIILVLLFSFLSCNNQENEKQAIEIDKNIVSDLQVDHLNIWVKNPEKAKQKINRYWIYFYSRFTF